jgi:K+-transporting ATPase ATPase B chain
VFSVDAAGQGSPVTLTVLVALLVCLIPTTIGGPAVGHRHRGHEPHDAGQRARHSRAGRGGRRAMWMCCCWTRPAPSPWATARPSEFLPAPGCHRSEELAEAAQLASLADETPEGRSIVVLAKERFKPARIAIPGPELHDGMHFVPFTAQTRMSGVDLNGTASARAPPAVVRPPCWSASATAACPSRLQALVDDGMARAAHARWWWPTQRRCPRGDRISRTSSRAASERFRPPAQDGHQDRDDHGRQPLTAAAIAAEAGVDDFLAEATPEAKLTS